TGQLHEFVGRPAAHTEDLGSGPQLLHLPDDDRSILRLGRDEYTVGAGRTQARNEGVIVSRAHVIIFLHDRRAAQAFDQAREILHAAPPPVVIHADVGNFFELELI